MSLDPYQSSVTVLLFTESGALKDCSPVPKSTPAGTANVYVSAAQYKYGSSSLFTDTYGAVVGDTTVGNLGAADFTIETWAFQQTTTRVSPTVFRYNAATGTANGRVQLSVGATDSNLYISYTAGAYDLVIPIAGGRPSLDAWHHYAVTRQGNLFTVWVDGVNAGSGTAAITFTAQTAGVGVGTGEGSQQYFEGFIDEFRVTLGVARYTAAFTPPASFAGTAVAALTSPLATVSASAGGSAALTVPRHTLLAFGGASSASTAPSPTLYGLGHESSGEQAADLTAPSPTLRGYAGATSVLAAPKQTLAATGTVTIAARAALTTPSPTLSATGTVSGVVSAALKAPSPNLVGYGGAVCSITLTGSPTLQATGTTGGVASAALTCPLFQLSAGATVQNHGSANLLAPSPRMGVTAQAWLVAPGARLTAIGSAVITATYEAYAVNLKHTARPGTEPVDEATRYTNFPFTHVIRHKGSYYGANSTGLYLLEGTTDDTAPITWTVKTAMTDFKNPDKKTIATAYFGGRFGPASTVQLHAGEHAPNTYSFTTPRDQLAQNYRQVFGKGVKERYYALGASGTGVMELDNIELDVHKLTRRI